MCAALLPVPGVTDGLPKMGDLLVIFYLFPIPAMAIMLAGLLVRLALRRHRLLPRDDHDACL